MDVTDRRGGTKFCGNEADKIKGRGPLRSDVNRIQELGQIGKRGCEQSSGSARSAARVPSDELLRRPLKAARCLMSEGTCSGSGYER